MLGSASFRSCAGKLASRPAAQVMAGSRAAGAGPASRSCSSSARTLPPMASTSRYAGEPLEGAGAESRRVSSIWPASSARSAPGCACTMSIPIRMSSDVLELMADGKILPYLDIPFQHASPARPQGDAPTGAPGEDAQAAGALARGGCPRPRRALDLHRRLPRRDGGRFRGAAWSLGWKEAKLMRVGCFKYEAVDGAAANDLGGAVPESVKEERWHRFMAAPAGGEPRADGSQGGPNHRRDRR